MAKNNKTYKFSEDWWEQIRLMDISERGIIITAICERVFEGRCREQVLPEYKQRVLDSILADIEKQLQHASEVSRKRSQAGTAGMANRYAITNVRKNITNVTENVTNVRNSITNVTKNITNVSENITNVTNARARNNQQHNTSYNINNNSVDDDENILRAKIFDWLTDNSIRMEYICKNNKLIDSPKTDDELKQILAPYIEEFICHLFTTKPTDKIERIDTISHFTNWIRIHLKQQGNGISQPQRPTEDEYNESF